ncbi:MAG: SAM-dependent methyltransferase [Anaerolineales bacterium]|nr:SAM-dependent methyltransferase [Anaerolineales bacterium]
MKNHHRIPASFRDPSGFLFSREGQLYRQINETYREQYQALMDSGLYASLVRDGLLLEHTEVDATPAEPAMAFKIIRPESLPFISYPYEWCFGQLKDAALTTLAIQKRALEFGMSLKDCSAYNIQFHRGRPVLIDTLSFELYIEGEPWVAYRQFCQHFLAPLALMALQDVRLNQLLRVNIDGVPLDLASNLLPGRTKLNLGLRVHIHAHAASQRRYADKIVDKETVSRKMSRTSFLGWIDSLERSVRGLEWEIAETEWGDYYDATHNYTPAALDHKRQTVDAYLESIQPTDVWDLGANVGFFSRLASNRGIPTLAFDIDPAAVEQNYRTSKAEGEENLLPLLLDLTNPSPNLGWHNQERDSLLDRGPADAILALAFVHHMAISNNVPLNMLADFFHHLGTWLIVEFVPKTDSQVQRLLAMREDIFPDYTREGFERLFEDKFTIQETTPIRESERMLYLMKRRTNT